MSNLPYVRLFSGSPSSSPRNASSSRRSRRWFFPVCAVIILAIAFNFHDASKTTLSVEQTKLKDSQLSEVQPDEYTHDRSTTLPQVNNLNIVQPEPTQVESEVYQSEDFAAAQANPPPRQESNEVWRWKDVLPGETYDWSTNPPPVNLSLVQPGDFIYQRDSWDGSPVVIEKYQLLFFTVAKVSCTTWKQIFRRMMGYKNWKEEKDSDLPWNPAKNGLRYLYDYPIEKASFMMSSPNWTRAIFVRDPIERYLSAYLDKGVRFENQWFRDKKINLCCSGLHPLDAAQNSSSPAARRHQLCSDKKHAIEEASKSADSFFRFASLCPDNHWQPMSQRMALHQWKYVNFVGHLDNSEIDAKRLLRHLGAWEEHGKFGFGPDGQQHAYQSSHSVRHSTSASTKMKPYISQKLERELDEYYRLDYEIKALNLTKKTIY